MALTYEEAKNTVNKFRVKYPGAYDDMDDATLATKIAEKYPDYRDVADAYKRQPAAAPESDLDYGYVAGPDGQMVRTRVDQMPALSPFLQQTSEAATVRPEQGEAAAAALEGQFDRATAAGQQIRQTQPQLQEYQQTTEGLNTDINRLEQTRIAAMPTGMRSVTTALAGVGQSIKSMGARVFGAEGEADEVNRSTQQFMQNVEIAAPGFANRVADGLARTVADVAAYGPTKAIYAIFAAQTANEAITKGRDAGLEGSQLAGYVTEQASIEYVTSKIFDKLGLGGAEAQSVKQAVRDGIVKAGIKGATPEVIEEVGIAYLQAKNDVRRGVDPDAMNKFQQGLPVLLTVAAVGGGGRNALNQIGQPGAEPARNATGEELTDSFLMSNPAERGPNTEGAALPDTTQRMLPAPTPGQVLGDQPQRLLGPAEPVQAAPAPVKGPGFFVAPDGTAMSSAIEPEARQQVMDIQARQEAAKPKSIMQQARESKAETDRLAQQAEAAQSKQADLQKRIEAQGIKVGTPKAAESVKIGDLTFKTEMTPAEIDDHSALLSPREDLTDPDEIDADIELQKGNREAAFKRPGDNFVMVDLPVAAFEPRNLKEGLAKGEKYKNRKGETAPPIVAGIPAANDTGKLVTTDGDTRLKAALLRGDTTIKAYIPAGDLAELKERLAAKQGKPPKLGKKPAPAPVRESALSLPITQLQAQIDELTQQGAKFRQEDKKIQARRVEQATDRLIKERDRLVKEANEAEADAEAKKVEAQDKQAADAKKADEDFIAAQVAKAASARKISQPDSAATNPKPNKAVQKQADAYAKSVGLPPTKPDRYAKVNPVRAARIAKAYEAMEHTPDDPRVRASYEALKTETMAQFEDLKAKGVKFEFVDTNPYPSSAAMAADIRDNNRLRVFKTEAGFGQGDQQTGNPLLDTVPGSKLTYNDVFRAVHDYYGHAAHGYGFGPRGEENAWRAHSQMYSDVARPAMTTETRGQNSWVNFGPKGAENRANPANTTYAEQKTGLLPEEFWTAEGLRPVDASALVAAVGEAATRSIAEGTAPSPDSQRSDKLRNLKETGTATQPGSTMLKSKMQRARAAKSADEVVHKATRNGFVKWLSEMATPIEDRLRNIAPRIFGRLMKMQTDAGEASERLTKAALPEINKLNESLTPEQKKAFAIAVWNEDFDAAGEIAEAAGQGDAFDTLISITRGITGQYKDIGITKLIENYWPRRVSDLDGLRSAIGHEDYSVFEKAWEAQAEKIGRPLNSEEKIEVANMVLQGYGPKKPGDLGSPLIRPRSLKVTDDTFKFYDDPFSAFVKFIHDSTYFIERSKFLGKYDSPLGDTVASIVQKEVDAGNMPKERQDEVAGLLNSRFTADMLHPSRTIQNIRALGYGALLSKLTSGIRNMTDVAMTAVRHGPIKTLLGLKDSAANRLFSVENTGRWTMEDIGVHAHGEELHNLRKTAAALNWALKLPGFTFLDRTFKESTINAARRKFSSVTPGTRAYKDLASDWAPIMGQKEFDQALVDLREGKKTDNGRLLLFMDLTNQQPTTLSSMPEKYLQMRDGRLLYAFKPFMLKQWANAKRETVGRMAKGEYRRGFTNMVKFASFMAAVGVPVEALIDWMMGREVRPDQIPDRVANAFLRFFGLSTYTLSNAKADPMSLIEPFLGGPGGFVPVADAARDVMALPEIMAGDKGFKTLRHIPVLGEWVNNHSIYGQGYYSNTERAKQEKQAVLLNFKKEAAEAWRSGDDRELQKLITSYNDFRFPDATGKMPELLTAKKVAAFATGEEKSKATKELNKQKAAEFRRTGVPQP